eukprot:1963823-Rhodomonas_salina.1
MLHLRGCVKDETEGLASDGGAYGGYQSMTASPGSPIKSNAEGYSEEVPAGTYAGTGLGQDQDGGRGLMENAGAYLRGGGGEVEVLRQRVGELLIEREEWRRERETWMQERAREREEREREREAVLEAVEAGAGGTFSLSRSPPPSLPPSPSAKKRDRRVGERGERGEKGGANGGGGRGREEGREEKEERGMEARLALERGRADRLARCVLSAYTPKSNTRNRIPGTKCSEIAYDVRWYDLKCALPCPVLMLPRMRRYALRSTEILYDATRELEEVRGENDDLMEELGRYVTCLRACAAVHGTAIARAR